jgi:hypothetical protein
MPAHSFQRRIRLHRSAGAPPPSRAALPAAPAGRHSHMWLPRELPRSYRLRLRDADNAFFSANVLEAFLPTRFRLAGVAAGGVAAEDEAAVEGSPLRNETHWRLYENAAFLRTQLEAQVAERGLNLQVGAKLLLDASSDVSRCGSELARS